MNAERLIGEVVFFTDFRGYGFVKSGKSQYFIHVSAIHSVGPSTLDPGDRVEFTPRQGLKGPMAVDVRVLKSVGSEEDHPDKWVIMKKNPFTPQDPIIDPNKFAGRRSHFHNAIDAIYNSKNLLITGNRGIGKSSIAYQLLYLAAGDNTLADRFGIDLGGETLDRITGDYRCTPGNSLADLATGLITTLQESTGSRLRTIRQEEEVSFDLKYFKLGNKETLEPVSTGDLATMFAIDAEHIFRKCDSKARGITFLIDEIDVLLGDLDVAPFLKAVVEKMRLSHHLSVSFIVSGVTGITTNLLLQHPSAGRLFENLTLGPMDGGELGEIIDLCLADTGVEISEHAKNIIIGISNHFPQPVHLVGYHAFRLDSDAFIDVTDVDRAKSFVVTNLKNQEFQERFQRLIQGGIGEVSRSLAISRYETVSLSYFKAQLPKYDEKTIIKALKELQDHGIVEEQSLGIWRFQDPLFKVYLRLVLGLDERKAGQERGQARPSRRSRK